MLWRRRGIEVKTPEQVRDMRRAGLVVGRTAARTTVPQLIDFLRRRSEPLAGGAREA